MKQVFDTMSEATGVDFSEIMRAGTYDAKVTRKIELSGEDVNVQARAQAQDEGTASAEEQ